MNYIERLLESQYANDELKDYLNSTKKGKVKDNPKLHQKYKIPVSPTSHKNASRSAQSILNAPNANRLSVILNSKFRFNKINALAKQDKKYNNLVWILCTEKVKPLVIEYLNQKLKLQQDGDVFNIGSKNQIRCANIDKKGVQNYFISQNGAEFVEDIEKLTAKDKDDAPVEDTENASDEILQNLRTKKDSSDFQHALTSDEHREDIIGWDPDARRPVYKRGSKGWLDQKKKDLKDAGIDLSKGNLDPTSWSVFKSLKQAS